MDKLVGAIQSTNPHNDNELKLLRGLLQKEEAILVKNLPVLDDVLNVLDPVQHSLGYAFILSVRILTPKLDGARFLAVAQRFLVNASNNQIRLVGGRFSAVAHKYTQLCIESGQPMKAIKTLRLVIVKLRPNSESLTAVHADLIQCCLVAKNYTAALPTLEEEIFEVNNDSTGVTPRDFLLYYYYGGMIYTGLKDYKKALNFFRTAVTAPAIVMSAIMAESYKKYILLSLLVHGKVLPLPRFTSSVMQRHHKSSFPHYHEIANAYSTNSTDDLHKVAQTHLDAFSKDHNFGLIKQVIQSLYRRNIQRYTQTYVTFSLQDIAQGAKIESVQAAEQLLLKMIEKGEIFATINQQNGMVSFHEDPEAFDTSNTLNNINTQIQTAIDLSKRVKATDESIASGIDYIRKTSGGHERGGRSGGFGEYEEFNEGADKIPLGAGPGRLM